MSDDLSQELRAFEGSDALGAGDFSVCIRGADCIESQAARITKMTEVMELALRYFENRIDVNDGDYGVPEANQEMYLYTYLKEVLDSD